MSSYAFFQDGIIALNFAFDEEAETFLHISTTTVANRNRRREGKQNCQLLLDSIHRNK